jgi:hypothetical protein
MLECILLGEDIGHETVIRTVMERVAAMMGRPLRVSVRSSRGGYGRMQSELGEFVKDLVRQPAGRPDLLVLATDANCVGRRVREEQLLPVLGPLQGILPVVLAIPDPHIERWLLMDSRAFKTVLGRGCNAPVDKCKRDLYKKLLEEAVRDAGWRPMIRGMEHAEDLVKAMDFERVRHVEESFGCFLDDLEAAIKSVTSPK